ncbi:uncharacterized protein EI90DRAFT_3013189 [Cantharellus anzutake]|uniref:uncharacterized protein n=1 Tax=Cantharellus anzutake TaxID=1750568 RepID=UPI001903485B|nr:uncharacterized protein EI90DRAFT_3013189 [Cantharellus anzutake]KAF8339137.1 hypothetical protein EI90DRAFT_3013189 [Cantharellus anzutake]
MSGVYQFRKLLKSSEKYHASKASSSTAKSETLRQLHSIPGIGPSVPRQDPTKQPETQASAADAQFPASVFHADQLEGFETSDPPQPQHTRSALFIGVIPISLDDSKVTVACTPLEARRSNHAMKRAKQHAHWDGTVLPQLIPVYTQWKRLHHSGVSPVADACNCGCGHQPLKVTCVHFDWKEEILLLVCDVRPSYIQLIE